MKILNISDLDMPAAESLIIQLSRNNKLHVFFLKLRTYLIKNNELSDTKRDKCIDFLKSKIAKNEYKLFKISNELTVKDVKKIRTEIENLEKFIELLDFNSYKPRIIYDLNADLPIISKPVDFQTKTASGANAFFRITPKYQKQHVMDYVPSALNPVVNVSFSEIMREEFNCPFNSVVIDKMSENEQDGELLLEFYELCIRIGVEFSETGNTYHRKLIALLNRPYVNKNKRIENDIETAINKLPDLKERYGILLEELNMRVSSFKYRNLSQHFLDYFNDEPCKYGIRFQSRYITPEGIAKALNSFQNCEFIAKEFNGEIVYVLSNYNKTVNINSAGDFNDTENCWVR
jgi:hypothetical protein